MFLFLFAGAAPLLQRSFKFHFFWKKISQVVFERLIWSLDISPCPNPLRQMIKHCEGGEKLSWKPCVAFRKLANPLVIVEGIKIFISSFIFLQTPFLQRKDDSKSEMDLVTVACKFSNGYWGQTGVSSYPSRILLFMFISEIFELSSSLCDGQDSQILMKRYWIISEQCGWFAHLHSTLMRNVIQSRTWLFWNCLNRSPSFCQVEKKIFNSVVNVQCHWKVNYF